MVDLVGQIAAIGNNMPQNKLRASAREFVALDSRIMSALHTIAPMFVKQATTPSSKRGYVKIENALRTQVCPRYGIPMAELDQWLFHGNEDARLVAFLASV